MVRAARTVLVLLGNLHVLIGTIAGGVASPSPGPARAAPDVLLTRARQCRQQRGSLPDFAAVDLYDRGDLLGVVDTLDGLG